VPAHDRDDGRWGRPGQDELAQRFVLGGVGVVSWVGGEQGLPGQSQTQVAVGAGQHPDVTDDVVGGLVAGAEHLVVDGGRVVLGVDPLGDDGGRRQDRLQDRVVPVEVGVVVVQEHPPVQVQVAGQRPRADDERRVAGQSPLRERLRPVPGPVPQLAGQHGGWDGVGRDTGQERGTFGSDGVGGCGQASLQPCQCFELLRGGVQVRVDAHLVSGGVVHGGDGEARRRDDDALVGQRGSNVGVVEDVGQDPGVDVPAVATAGPAVVRGGERVVLHRGPVAADDQQWREPVHQPESAQDVPGDLGPLVGGQAHRQHRAPVGGWGLRAAGSDGQLCWSPPVGAGVPGSADPVPLRGDEGLGQSRDP